MSAILFGSISTIADTSELQRNAFNRAFAEHGLQWNWPRSVYGRMLESSGGQNRIAAYADSVGQNVDARAIHELKSKLFQDSLSTAELTPRAGVVETIRQAHENGFKVGFVSLTSRENITALLESLAPELTESDFDVVLDVTSVASPKPDPAAYKFALQRLDEKAEDCVAVEDNVPGVHAAIAAGITCVAFPNVNTAEHDFGVTEHRVEHVDFTQLHTLARGE